MVKATDLNCIVVGIIFDICFIRERRFEPCRCRIRLVNFLLSFWVGFFLDGFEYGVGATQLPKKLLLGRLKKKRGWWKFGVESSSSKFEYVTR